MKIAKTFRFEAAHALKEWPETHKCHHMHGHSYKVEICVSGVTARSGDMPGAVIDFGELSEWWREKCFKRLDHLVLNEVLTTTQPTAENLAIWLAGEFKRWKFSREIQLDHVRVWETEDSYAEVSG